MASLKTIITVSVLKKIPQDILLRKLSHIRDELVSLNILSQDNAIKHQALAHYLHEHCPQDLENFICSFALIAQVRTLRFNFGKVKAIGRRTISDGRFRHYRGNACGKKHTSMQCNSRKENGGRKPHILALYPDGSAFGAKPYERGDFITKGENICALFREKRSV